MDGIHIISGKLSKLGKTYCL